MTHWGMWPVQQHPLNRCISTQVCGLDRGRLRIRSPRESGVEQPAGHEARGVGLLLERRRRQTREGRPCLGLQVNAWLEVWSTTRTLTSYMLKNAQKIVIRITYVYKNVCSAKWRQHKYRISMTQSLAHAKWAQLCCWATGGIFSALNYIHSSAQWCLGSAA